MLTNLWIFIIFYSTEDLVLTDILLVLNVGFILICITIELVRQTRMGIRFHRNKTSIPPIIRCGVLPLMIFNAVYSPFLRDVRCTRGTNKIYQEIATLFLHIRIKNSHFPFLEIILGGIIMKEAIFI